MKKAKRILSALLCLCMIASFMPIGAPSAQAADSITYKFDRFDWTTPLTDYTYAFTGKDWRYHSYSESLWENPDFTVSNGNFTAITGGLQFDLEGGRWVAMGIKVPASGVYSASGTYAGFWKSGVNEYYIIPAAGATSEAAIAAQLTEDNLIGSKDEMTESWSAKNAITFSDVTIPEAGEYLLVIKGGSANEKYGYWWNFFETLVLTKKSEYIAPGVEPVEKTYTFQRKDWSTPITDYTYAFTGNDWRYHSYSESIWANPDFTVSNGDLTTVTGALQFDLQGERWVALEIKVPASGIYSASGTYAGFWKAGINEYYIIPAAGATSEAAIAAQLTEKNFIGSKDEYLGSWTLNQEVTFSDVTIPEAGEYLLVIKGSGRASSEYGYWSFFSSLTLNKKANYEAPEVEVSANFGEHYAYMTKLGNKCYLTVIGGIKDIEGYSEVGFEVSVNGGEMKLTQSSTNVYETINHNGAAIDTSKIGADVDYLFYETFEMNAAAFARVTDLSFKAYAVGAEGNEYGAEYELPLN